MDQFLANIPGWPAYLVSLFLAYLFVKERWFKVKIDGIQTKKSTLDYQSDQIEELKKLIALKDEDNKKASEFNRSRNEALARELSSLQGQLIEKDKQAKEYLAILQNRDPKLEQLMTQIATALRDIHDFMKINVNPISAIK